MPRFVRSARARFCNLCNFLATGFQLILATATLGGKACYRQKSDQERHSLYSRPCLRMQSPRSRYVKGMLLVSDYCPFRAFRVLLSRVRLAHNERCEKSSSLRGVPHSLVSNFRNKRRVLQAILLAPAGTSGDEGKEQSRCRSAFATVSNVRNVVPATLSVPVHTIMAHTCCR
jgi:hypothetical protein